MRHITDEQLAEMTQGGKYEWQSDPMDRHVADSGNVLYFPRLNVPFSFQCLRCHAHFIAGECSNCGRADYQVAESGGLGLFCRACEHGFSNWACTECGTQNPAAKTLFTLKKKGMCFIATAAYGSPAAPELTTFYQFRDQILLASSCGRAFVCLYYATAPTVARGIAGSPFLRTATRWLLLNPLAWLIKILRREK